MHCWYFVYFTKILFWFELVLKIQHEGSVSTFPRQVISWFSLIIWRQFGWRIQLFNNTKSLIKTAKEINKQEVFDENRKNFQPSQGRSDYEKKRVPRQSNLFSGHYETGEN